MEERDFRFVLSDEVETRSFGAALARACQPPVVIHLRGDLGAGKTTLTRGFLRGLGYTGAVKSPTYTLMEPYAVAPWRVYHLDLYRLADPSELEYLGLRDCLDEHAILLIEWPERGGDILPPADVELILEYAPPGRVVRVRVASERGRALLSRFEYS